MRLPVAVIVLVAAGLSGCGTDDEDAADVARQFLAAVSEQDGDGACRELSEATRAKLEKDEMSPCAEALETVGLSGEGEVVDTEVYVTEARVSLGNGEFAFLGRTPTGWKVSAAGCRPAGGREQPYDCELES